MRTATISTLIALLVAIGTALWAANAMDTVDINPELALSERIIPVALAIISGMAAYILTLGWSIGLIDEKIDRNRDNDRKESEKAIREMNSMTFGRDTRALMNEKHVKLLRKESHLLRQFGTAAAEQFFDDFDVGEASQTVSFTGQQAAIRSNVKFWQELTKLQSARDTGDPIRVYVTHSNSIRIWGSSRAEALYDEQSAFTSAGGIICRIFVDVRDAKEVDMVPAYVEVMRKMNGKDIHTAYLPRITDELTTSGRERYDFIFTVIGNDNYALSWSASNHSNYIVSSRMEVNTVLFDKNRGDWEYIFDTLKSFDYNVLEIADHHLDFLKSHRDKVISIGGF